MSFDIAKVDDDRRLVFGYANVAVSADGVQIEDSQGDLIDPQDLEDAAYEFVLKFGDSGVMHAGEAVGKMVESFVITPEKLAAIGLVAKADGVLPKAAWWVGFHVEPDAFAKVKDGTYKMFSIQGTGEREPLAKDWSTWKKPTKGGQRMQADTDHGSDALKAAVAGGSVKGERVRSLMGELKRQGFKQDSASKAGGRHSISYVRTDGTKATKVRLSRPEFTLGRQAHQVEHAVEMFDWHGSPSEGSWKPSKKGK
jgi:hypothetical protein